MDDTVTVRDLRNHTARVVERLRRGQTTTLTSSGQPIGRIIPLPGGPPMSRDEFLAMPKADRALLDELRRLDEDLPDDYDRLIR